VAGYFSQPAVYYKRPHYSCSRSDRYEEVSGKKIMEEKDKISGGLYAKVKVPIWALNLMIIAGCLAIIVLIIILTV
jgi:hypothetical protein